MAEHPLLRTVYLKSYIVSDKTKKFKSHVTEYSSLQ